MSNPIFFYIFIVFIVLTLPFQYHEQRVEQCLNDLKTHNIPPNITGKVDYDRVILFCQLAA